MTSRFASMLRFSATLALACTLITLAACGGKGFKEYVFAPEISIKELSRQNGQWQLTMRVHNRSNVTHTIERLGFDLFLGAAPLGRIVHQERIEIPAESAEPVIVTHTFTPTETHELDAAASQNMPLEYRLEGDITSVEPDSRQDDFRNQGTLQPVPGLEATFR